MTTAALIQHNAQELRDLHDEIHRTLKFRHESDSGRARWEEACRRFHQSYDQLAFPGGVSQWLTRLEMNDSGAIEDAVIFLEVDPIFFRSGYLKERALKYLRWAPLNDDQKRRLRLVILARVYDPKIRREFRRYCGLAPVVSNAEFEEQIARLAGSSGTKPRGAQLVLDRLEQGLPRRKH
jgi:hypothetical protein